MDWGTKARHAAAIAACLVSLWGCEGFGDAKAKRDTIPPKRPAKPAVQPKSLVGITQTDAAVLFGRPNAKKHASPATVWIWRNGGCRLELFFYMDLNDQVLRALTYEIKGKAANRRACLTGLRDKADRAARTGT